MTNTLPALLLSAQLLFTSAPPAAPEKLPCLPCQAQPARRLWWGMIDPEMSAWFARLPRQAEDASADFQWDWSWQGFLAAIFGDIATEEDAINAAHV